MKSNCIFNKKINDCCVLEDDEKIGVDEKFHYIYKIEFPDGKYYIGEHTTKNLNDGYCGSGSLLPFELKKYDISNIKKTILSFHDSKKEMELMEEKTIGNLYKEDRNCLNLIKGGSKGFSEHIIEKSVNSRIGKKRSKESIEKQRLSCIGKHHSEETKNKQSEWHKNFWSKPESNHKRNVLKEKGRSRIITEEFKEKISNSRKKYNSSDYGKNMNRYRYYVNEVNCSDDKEKILYLLKKSKNSSLSIDENTFLEEFWDISKKNRLKKRLNQNKPKKEKYVFTDEHKKNISESKKGKKLSTETKEKMSKMRSGKGNPRYIPNKIQMFDIYNNFIMEFNDCIDAINYVKENINPKANGSEIFIACRKNKVRYNHKWKIIK